jgi:hypothetical protein
MAQKPQSFENHTKTVPAFLYTLLLVAFNLLWQLYNVVVNFSLEAIVSILAAFALFMILGFTRRFALGVQDRVIRLEERLRLAELAPDIKPRLDELTINQVCALRFATNAEAPALARKVLDEKLDNRKEIKQMIRNWKPDHVRV